MTPREVINGNRSGPHKQPKNKWALTLLDSSCGPLRSPFVTFFGVVVFVLSRFFFYDIGDKVVKIAILTRHEKYKTNSDRKIVRNFKIH